jgi:peptide deformylase
MSDVEGQVINEELDAQREARRRLALAQIRQYPDAALKMQARPVEQFDDELVTLVERMKRLMHDASGIGLAATQVGVLQRIFVFHPNEDEDTVAVVNPEIVDRSDETDVAEEGCLSIQNILVPVERSVTVTLVGRNETGEEVRYELDDIYARAAQHETDHLDGVLMLDRTTQEARREALGKLRPRIVLG